MEVTNHKRKEATRKIRSRIHTTLDLALIQHCLQSQENRSEIISFFILSNFNKYIDIFF